MRHILLFMALPPFACFSQIPNDLVGLAKIGSEFRLVRVDPNNGNTNCIGTQTFASLYGIINGANTCSANIYVFGSGAASPSLNVVNLNTGNIQQSFPCQMRFIDYNPLDGMYYGISNGGFLNFNISNGTYSTITTHSLPVNTTCGGFINSLNNTYVTFDSNKLITFSCQNGNYTVSPSSTLIPYGLAFSKTLNKCFGVENNSPTRFCEISLTTGSVTIINTFQGKFYYTGNGASCGASINEQAKVYSYTSGINNEIISIDLNTGTIVSNPSTGTQPCFLRYVCDNSQLNAGYACVLYTGIEENSPPQSQQGSTYYNLYGQKIEPEPGVLMIERCGNSARKVIIEK